MSFNITGTDFTTAFGDGEKYGEQIKGNAEYTELYGKVDFDGNQSNGDVFPLFVVQGNDVITGGGYYNEALTGMTDIDIGLYYLDGAVVDADFFVDGDSLASAQTTRYGGSILSASGVSAVGDEQLRLHELSTDLSAQDQYVVAITTNTAGSATGLFLAQFKILRDG